MATEIEPSGAGTVDRAGTVRDLSFGMKGDDVAEWQRQLMRDGYGLSPYNDDGKFGRLTQKATVAWQSAHGLPPTGIVDNATRAAVQAPARRLSYGVDSLRPVASRTHGQTLAELAMSDLGGERPQFWGRYISRPGHSDYKPEEEAASLRTLGIHVLPIARQTGHVGGNADTGKVDALNNVLALKEAFGSDALKQRKERLYVFLDVEADTPLSREYYAAWASEIANADIMLGPCLYLPNYTYHPKSWKALQAAMDDGAECAGLWIAWYLRNPGAPFEPPASWDSHKVANPTRVPVLAWQYLGDVHDHTLDYSVVNPAIDLDTDLLSHLVLPS